MCKESWLKNAATEEQSAEAMMVCQHPFGLCFQDQYCHYNGQCFKKKEKSQIDALISRVEDLEQTVWSLKNAIVKN